MKSSRKPTVTDLWVVNASPIISLANCGCLELINKLCDEAVVPQSVVDEIIAGPESDPARLAIEGGWGIRIRSPVPCTDLIEWGLGAGETAVLALALERSPATVVLDDAVGRACAKAMNVQVIGTIGIIIRAKKRSLIPSAATAIASLRDTGLYLSDDVVAGALRYCGEE